MPSKHRRRCHCTANLRIDGTCQYGCTPAQAKPHANRQALEARLRRRTQVATSSKLDGFPTYKEVRK